MALFVNPRRGRPTAGADVLTEAGAATAAAEIAGWPGYAVTPLLALPGLARRLGIGGLRYKDEGGRFGLKSFKAMGGAYAVFRLLQAAIARAGGPPSVSAADLAAGRHREWLDAPVVTCATDGNHGRAVAWGARTFGAKAVIYIHATVSEGRERATASYGAEVVRVQGTYDDAVRQAAADAERLGRQVVSDTSYPGYLDVPVDVMHGYTLMASEIAAQLGSEGPPTHVFVQGGVGGLPAAICARFAQLWGDAAPRFVSVEPTRAACLYASAVAGRPTAVEGDLDTMQAGLACGEVSLVAWPVLDHGAFAFMTVGDDEAMDAMRTLAAGTGGDAPVVAGESAVAGLAGLTQAMADAGARAALGLDAASRVLLIGSEADTDPETYARIVGASGDEVRARRGAA